ncbi:MULTISPECIES: hypothetical protein [Methylobacterium]|uniref:hypothetical protein n=1 Tax=Methylobacterium TaxID=407 RepID=UPI0008EE3EE0|nr:MULTISPECIES: hypothetical protein [Methylobacterium]MBZ6416105.1 hypothetical protein [Methylobacterium sp.]SFF56698.1 hypothetical protein SAMN04487844_12775 [Methylobacterium sp. yr596]
MHDHEMQSRPGARCRRASACLAFLALVLMRPAWAQTVEDGSDGTIGPADTARVLALIRQDLNSPDAKVTQLRRSGASHVCGSVNVKNRDGLYTGERGFVVDLPSGTFGRVPDGPELLSPRAAGFAGKEAIRQSYFRLCLDD